MRDMSWDEFEQMLIDAGWSAEDAKREREANEHGAAIVRRSHAFDQTFGFHLLQQPAKAGTVEHCDFGDLADGLAVFFVERTQDAPRMRRKTQRPQHLREIDLVLALHRREIVHRIIEDAVGRFGNGRYGLRRPRCYWRCAGLTGRLERRCLSHPDII